ncbi:hypothetical protein HG530_001825 [Fusarium avenaceum]|nr:hypothetical protein HG530_001825 [Fusarium avenaceum]
MAVIPVLPPSEIPAPDSTKASAGAVEDVDVQESDERKTELATVTRNIELEDVERAFDLVEIDHLFEEVESIGTKCIVREVCDGGVAWPRDDTDEQNSSNNGAFDTIHHEQHSKDTTAEDTNPHGRVPHLLRRRAESRSRVPSACHTACQFQRSRDTAYNETNAFAVGKTDECQEQANTNTGGKLDATRNGTSKPLTHTEQGKTKEDEAFNENSCQSKLIGHRTRSIGANHGIGEIGIETHSRSKTDREIGKQTHEESSEGRYSSSSSDCITLDLSNTQLVITVYHTCAVFVSRTNTGTAGFGDDGGVHSDDVGHGEEGGKASSDFGEEQRALALTRLVEYDISCETDW